jgi:hypothetical protein
LRVATKDDIASLQLALSFQKRNRLSALFEILPRCLPQTVTNPDRHALTDELRGSPECVLFGCLDPYQQVFGFQRGRTVRLRALSFPHNYIVSTKEIHVNPLTCINDVYTM